MTNDTHEPCEPLTREEVVQLAKTDPAAFNRYADRRLADAAREQSHGGVPMWQER